MGDDDLSKGDNITVGLSNGDVPDDVSREPLDQEAGCFLLLVVCEADIVLSKLPVLFVITVMDKEVSGLFPWPSPLLLLLLLWLC